jgi:phage gpG-like protein
MAKTIVSPNNLTAVIQARINQRISQIDNNSIQMRELLHYIGKQIENEAKLNIQKKGIVDTGKLLNSLSTTISKREGLVNVEVGVKGLQYANTQEYGGAFTDRNRSAMFKRLRESGRYVEGLKGKGIATNRFKARPFLEPAYKKVRKRMNSIIMGYIRKVFKGKSF